MADTPATTDDNTLYEQGHHVDIRHAEETFNELSRALSRKSTHNKGDDSDSSGDLEQGEVFDLREYLASSNDAHQSAGIKHKHVGVTWENLKVDVIGGADHKVSIIAQISCTAVVFIYASNVRYTFRPLIVGCISSTFHPSCQILIGLLFRGGSFLLAHPIQHSYGHHFSVTSFETQ